MNYLTGDISEPIPACLQVIIYRLVAWQLIPPSKVPDSCSIHILDEGDYLPPHIDHSHVERPFYTLTLLSECSLVLGHSLAMDAPGDFKGAFHLSLPVGYVWVIFLLHLLPLYCLCRCFLFLQGISLETWVVILCLILSNSNVKPISSKTS
jgi:hypothetical protein